MKKIVRTAGDTGRTEHGVLGIQSHITVFKIKAIFFGDYRSFGTATSSWDALSRFIDTLPQLWSMEYVD